VGEEADRGAHCLDVPGVAGDNDAGGKLALSGLPVRVEISGGEDTYVFGVEDRLREAGEEFVPVLREVSDGEGVDGELGLVVGEVEGQPGRLSHRECLVELGRQGIKVWCKSGSGGGRVGDEEGD